MKNEFNNASIKLLAHNKKTTSLILTTSTDTAGKFDRGRKPTLKRSISDPTFNKCFRDSFVPCGSPPYEPSFHLTSISANRNESSKQRKWGNSKGKVRPLATHTKRYNFALKVCRSDQHKGKVETCDNKANVNIFHSFRKGQENKQNEP